MPDVYSCAESAPTREQLLERIAELEHRIAELEPPIAGPRPGERRPEGSGDQALQLQKLESLGVMASGIAHEFNNLLTGILGNASLVLEEARTGERAKSYLQAVERNSNRAAELCGQLLAYAGRTPTVRQPLDLTTVARAMQPMLEVSVAKMHALRFDLADGLPCVLADAEQIRQLVLQLISNASEALGPAEGTIQVRFGERHCDRRYLAESYLDDGLPEGRYAFVSVVDDGPGMDPAMQARIFDPFFSTKLPGRGLGLSTVLGIVRNHGGALRVSSQAGQGTAVTVLLPISEEHLVEGKPAVDRPSTILVVDDEASVRELVRDSLERRGHRVVLAVDGREGLEKFCRYIEEIQVVILDMAMPFLSGDELLREMRQIRPEVPAILCTGYNEQEARNRFADQGPYRYLKKPFRPKDLRGAVDSSLSATP
ncbi:MAG: response regulator [Acidobacteriota bacterium]